MPEPADQDPAPPAWVAEAEEAEAVARLLVEFRDWHGRDWPPPDAFLSSVRRLMGNPDAEFLLAGTGDGSPPAAVGQVRYRHSVWTAADDCWIEDLFVTERARGRGLGEAWSTWPSDEPARADAVASSWTSTSETSPPCRSTGGSASRSATSRRVAATC